MPSLLYWTTEDRRHCWQSRQIQQALREGRQIISPLGIILSGVKQPLLYRAPSTLDTLMLGS